MGWGGCSGPRRAQAPITLDPANPSNFSKDGGQTATPGSVLTLTDTSAGDFVLYFANDADAAAGTEADVIATFQVRQTAPNNADVGNRLVINDGVNRSAIAACIIKGGVRGIGLLSQGVASDPDAYPVFVAVDWTASTSIRLLRTALGDAEIVEVGRHQRRRRPARPAARGRRLNRGP